MPCQPAQPPQLPPAAMHSRRQLCGHLEMGTMITTLLVMCRAVQKLESP